MSCFFITSHVQASYGSLRYGLYSPIKDALAPGVEKKDMPLGKKILAGGLSGTLAQGIGDPTHPSSSAYCVRELRTDSTLACHQQIPAT